MIEPLTPDLVNLVLEGIKYDRKVETILFIILHYS